MSPVFPRKSRQPVAATPSPPDPKKQWFDDHYGWAVGEIVDFLGGDGIQLAGRSVIDLGCGDGIMDLGLARRAEPERLVGIDVNPVDVVHLLEQAREHAGVDALPPNLEFRQSDPVQLPAENGEFDLAITWSAFEHIQDPIPLLLELRRVLRPEAVLMLQLWPFYYSNKGSHLWQWFPEGWTNLLHDDDTVAKRLREDATDAEFAEYMLGEYLTLNRITVDELQNCLLTAGFQITKFELMSEPVHIPPALNRYPLSLLGISGVKLLAFRSR
jgi:ubiquinone/menaquinone biosynthesis C-methylase UbiE